MHICTSAKLQVGFVSVQNLCIIYMKYGTWFLNTITYSLDVFVGMGLLVETPQRCHPFPIQCASKRLLSRQTDACKSVFLTGLADSMCVCTCTRAHTGVYECVHNKFCQYELCSYISWILLNSIAYKYIVIDKVLLRKHLR